VVDGGKCVFTGRRTIGNWRGPQVVGSLWAARKSRGGPANSASRRGGGVRPRFAIAIQGQASSPPSAPAVRAGAGPTPDAGGPSSDAGERGGSAGRRSANSPRRASGAGEPPVNPAVLAPNGGLTPRSHGQAAGGASVISTAIRRNIPVLSPALPQRARWPHFYRFWLATTAEGLYKGARFPPRPLEVPAVSEARSAESPSCFRSTPTAPRRRDAQHGGPFLRNLTPAKPPNTRGPATRSSASRPRGMGVVSPGAPSQGQSSRRRRYRVVDALAARSAALPDRAEAVARLQHPNIVRCRGRRSARPTVLFAGILRRRHAHRATSRQAADAAEKQPALIETLGGRCTTRTGGCASRPENRGMILLHRRHAEDHGFRLARASRRGRDVKQIGGDHGAGVVHGAGAGGRARCREYGPAGTSMPGALLYECLAGRRRSRGRSSRSGQRAERRTGAALTLAPKTPRTWNTICLKLSGEGAGPALMPAPRIWPRTCVVSCGRPVQARPVGRLERRSKWRGGAAPAALLASRCWLSFRSLFYRPSP